MKIIYKPSRCILAIGLQSTVDYGAGTAWPSPNLDHCKCIVVVLEFIVIKKIIGGLYIDPYNDRKYFKANKMVPKCSHY